MRATLNRVSLVTEVDAPHRAPDSRHFLDPAGYESAFSRVLLHEAVHYWQQLSQMFLLLLAEEDWKRLKRFDLFGEADPLGPLGEAFRTQRPPLNFSPHDLAEAAARYWDVLNLGPHRLVDLELTAGRSLDSKTRELYDKAVSLGLFRLPDDAFTSFSVEVAMRIVGGAYARPYLYLEERLGAEDAVTLFPLLAHWALQTPRPVELFEDFAELARRKVRKWSRWESRVQRLRTGGRILVRDLTEHQMRLYWQLSLPVYKFAKKRQAPLWTAGQYMQYTSLSNHPVYAWAAGWTKRLGNGLVSAGQADDLKALFAKDDVSGVALLAADRVLALPGGPENRRYLVEYLLPPLHRFSDDRTWFTNNETEHDDNVALADQCMAIHGHWEEFRKARRGY